MIQRIVSVFLISLRFTRSTYTPAYGPSPTSTQQVESGQTAKAVTEAADVCPRTVRKWVERYGREGVARIARPQFPPATPTAQAHIAGDRRSGSSHCALNVAPAGKSPSWSPPRRFITTSATSRRDDPFRHQRACCINKVGHRITGNRKGQSNSRGIGWEFVHVAVDDHSRFAFAKIMGSGRKRSATAFLKAATAYYVSFDIKVKRVMTDNGFCYKAFAFRKLCKRLGL